MRQISVGIREAKMNLSRLLKDVHQGAQIILTDRGLPVAKLVPVTPEELTVETRLHNLEQNGWVTPAPKGWRPLPPPLPVPNGLAQRYLEEDRNA
ncbi:MAG: type II toxin-antitoxin system prevent-host-death family antitoxin [Bacillota bacterium]|jgi:prevent-host-death family protein|uniref:type II toxin-antitoxin system Phd/YefM family antitoxin n=1 Tax=Desulforudis sp. DRI-14 TaxID=3459793 RepID=UPI003489B5CA